MERRKKRKSKDEVKNELVRLLVEGEGCGNNELNEKANRE